MIPVILLSALDIFAGVLLFKPDYFSRTLVIIISIALLAKGGYFLVGAVLSHSFEWMSAIDVIFGALLFFSVDAGWFAIVPVIKGVYCILLSLTIGKLV